MLNFSIFNSGWKLHIANPNKQKCQCAFLIHLTSIQKFCLYRTWKPAEYCLDQTALFNCFSMFQKCFHSSEKAAREIYKVKIQILKQNEAEQHHAHSTLFSDIHSMISVWNTKTLHQCNNEMCLQLHHLAVYMKRHGMIYLNGGYYKNKENHSCK